MPRRPGFGLYPVDVWPAEHRRHDRNVRNVRNGLHVKNGRQLDASRQLTPNMGRSVISERTLFRNGKDTEGITSEYRVEVLLNSKGFHHTSAGLPDVTDALMSTTSR